MEMLESKTFWQIMSIIFKFCCAMLLSWALIRPQQLFYCVNFIFSFRNYALLKISFSFFLFFYLIENFEKIINKIKWYFVQELDEDDENELINIEWVPVIDISKYLIVNKTFKVKEVQAYFWITLTSYYTIAEKLDEYNIIVRWENNQRNLNPAFTDETQIIQKIIKFFLKTSENCYSDMPSPIDNQ